MLKRRAFLGLAASAATAGLFRPAVASSVALRMYCAGAVQAAMEELAPEAGRRLGAQIAITYDVVGALAKRIEAGDVPDLVALTAPVAEDLRRRALLAADTPRVLGSVGVGVAVREGAAKPDITTTASFRAAVLNARSIVYADPGRGASSGIHVASVLQRLGIAEAVAAKTILKPGGYVVEAVASGTAELGLHQISEILPVPGVQLIGPLPPELQRVTTYVAAIGRTEHPDEAREVLAYLTGPDARAILSAKGLEPAA